MNKNISINFIIYGMAISGLDVIRGLNDSDYELFKYIAGHSSGLSYNAGRMLDHALKTVKISEASYWRKLKKFVELRILVKYGKGDYELNKKLFDILIREAHRLDETKI